MQHARFSHKSGEKGKRSPRACHVIISPTQEKEEGEMQGHAEKSGNISWQWGIREKGRVESLCTAKKRRQPSVFLLLFSLVCTVQHSYGRGRGKRNRSQ